ncbi:unnamed protein product [Orchesella dallaii]|uniref:N-acetyltransferase domain-containing protein n=1 Tax=Orchesella dallaii TaxID=48710 RepID=A0ABP1QBZ2_9HEXA
MASIFESNSVIIRNAKREDCPAILELKKELAAHQDMQGLPMLSAEDLQRDGFDTNPPCYQCIVAQIPPNSKDRSECENVEETQQEGTVVGYALYFFAYAAWEGKTVHLEDLCVSEKGRGRGIGSKMLKQLAKVAVEEKCARIQLEVLDSNETAFKFYNSHGGWNTTVAEGWHNFRIDKEALEKLAAIKI